MSKEKKRSVEDESPKETLFYYELIGSAIIILSVTILGKLGKVGALASIFFKILFGDWHWLFVLFILFLGFFLLFMHKKYNFKGNKTIGVLIISVTLLLYSSFPLHNYIMSRDNQSSYLSLVWDYYKSFLNSANNEYLGGGLIGIVLFYGIYYLLGKVGVIIFGIILILLALSLLINKPILIIFTTLFKKIKGTGKYFRSFNNFFKYQIGGNTTKDKIRNIYTKPLPIKFLEELDNEVIFNIQKRSSLNIKSIIKTVFNNFDYNYQELEMEVSYKVTTYKFLFFQKLEEKEIFKIIDKIMDVIENDLLYSIDYNKTGNNILILQVQNEQPITLTLYELIVKATSLKTLNPLGITYDNEVFEYDTNKISSIFLIGDYGSGITNFINSEIIKRLIIGGLDNYSFYFYDENRDFGKYNDIGEFSYNINSFFDEIKNIINERMEILKEYKVNTYLEYLKKIEMKEEKKILPKLLVVVGEIKNSDLDYSYIESKLVYILQFASKVGIELFYVCRNNNFISNILLSSFEIKLLFKCSEKISKKILNNENAKYLYGNGDALICINDNCKRIQLPLLTELELNKFIEYIFK